MMTLSAGRDYTPACAPVVLKRIGGRIPELGFVRSGAPDYEDYRQALEAVAPTFGFFAGAPPPTASLETRFPVAAE
jgi:hypothetical protein